MHLKPNARIRVGEEAFVFARPDRGLLTKTLRVMKFTAIILLAAVLQVSAKGTAQTVTFDAKEEPLTELFAEIKKQTGYSVFYRNQDIKNTAPVTVTLNAVNLAAALEIILKDQPLVFQIQKNTIFIRKKPVPAEHLSTSLLFPPPITVRGKIVNEKGEPLVASIIVEGTNKGVTTDMEGNFILENVDENAMLIVSGINIQTQKVKINGRSTLAINVITRIGAEEEVVINGGYYKTTDRTKTGSIAKITAKDIEKQPITSPLLSLQGRVAGVEVSPVSGIAGSAPKIQIRGQNSLRLDGGYPLYIVDGVPLDSRPITSGNVLLNGGGFDPLSTISPANIESIEVLKDADATAIYGSRGANGVILITTKNVAKIGRTNLDVSYYHGIGRITHKMDLLNSTQYLQMRNEAFANGGSTPSAGDATDLLIWDTLRYTDWQDVLLGGTSEITDMQASVSGGGNNTSFRLGGIIHKESMLIPGDAGYKNASVFLNLNHNSSNQKFKSLVNITYGANVNKLIHDLEFLQSAFKLPPNAPSIFNQDGTLNWENSTWTNPYSSLLRKHTAESDNLMANTSLQYNVLAGLIVKVNLGYNNLVSDELMINPISAIDPAYVDQFVKGRNSMRDTKRKSWVIEPQIVYNYAFNKQKITAIVGSTWQESETELKTFDGRGYVSDALLENMEAAESKTVSQNYQQYRYVSVFGRLGYDFNNKYLINLTGRRDGSSRFGPNYKFGNFGAVGMAWIFSEEEFIKDNIQFLTFGKLRSSYGVTGNDQIEDYRYYDVYSIMQFPYQNGISLSPSQLFNPEYRWEKTNKFEAAIELGVLNRRMSIEVSWYKNRSSNQLVSYPLPVTTGFQFINSNLNATVENSGWEFLIRSQNINSVSFRWLTSFNFTIPKNKLISFPGLKESPYSAAYVVGQPLSLRKLFSYTGVNPSTGFYEVQDADKNGSIEDPQDRNVVKSMMRKFYGGISNTLNFKSLELGFTLQFVKQPGLHYSTDFGIPGAFPGNQPIEILNRWKRDGDNSPVQKFTTDAAVYAPYYYFSNSDVIVVDASFLRLKTLTLSYNFSKSILSKIKLQDANIFIQGQNLFTITNFIGLDPETGVSGFPPLKVLTFGINIKI